MRAAVLLAPFSMDAARFRHLLHVIKSADELSQKLAVAWSRVTGSAKSLQHVMYHRFEVTSETHS